MTRLAINVDHVATVRQARMAREPDPVIAAALAELAGADGIVVHLREDRRHIQDRDLDILRQTVKTRLNLEMAATEELVQIALRVKPEVVTLVPEKRMELTTEGGLDVQGRQSHLQRVIVRLQEGGIVVSLFIDPDLDQVRASQAVQSDYVEIHTGSFAEASNPGRMEEEFNRIVEATALADEMGLGIHAGHGVDYKNIIWLRDIPEIEEFSIGHAVIARAVLVGMERAVREMIALLQG